ncbi:hypothetical protein [Geofilum rubicundum]|uniref:Uncharacterized protein n=1 Tax=Geofilum rubicundum JCM 15548 TaxID=1236989 RepID=A0A0E9LV28_9BACT|nr:hypothetical protein [Geofilum rubicundum]GAO28971.1 hypothetical protein JCM15548_11120 [Geofilum rubicundum JCM 15548]
MYRIVVTVIWWSVIQGLGYSQPVRQKTDSLTYQLYLSQEWKPLMRETRRSLHQGIDFFYLRVRAGIAAYELKKYRLAAHHLSKAYKKNSSDEFVNYWYYYSLVMSGRKDEANRLAMRFSDDYLSSMDIRKQTGVNSILAEVQISDNSEIEALLDENIAGAYNYLGYRNVADRQVYKAFGIDHRVSGRVYAFHGVSHLGISRMQLFQSPLTRINIQHESTTTQYQYYLQGRYLFDHGWMVTSSASLLWGEAVSHWFSYSSEGVPRLNRNIYAINDYVLNAGIAKELRWLRPKLSLSAGEISGTKQWQIDGQVIVYPLGNTNLYLTSDLSRYHDNGTDKNHHVFSQKLSIKTGPLWLTGEWVTGNIRNFSASDGYIVYNMSETIKGIAGITAWIPLFNNRFDITGRYRITDKEGLTFIYANTVDYQMAKYLFSEKSFLISLRYNL